MKNKIRKQNFIKPISKIIIFAIIIFILFIGFIIINKVSKHIIEKIQGLTKEEIEYISVLTSAIIETTIGSILASIDKTRKYVIRIYHIAELKLYKHINLSKRNNWRKNRYIHNFNNERIILYSSQSKAIHDFFDSLKNDSRNMFYIKGNYNVGKTSTIMMIFDKCSDFIDYYEEINRRSIYICSFFNEDQIQNFLERYKLEKYKNYYIFIDDISELSTVLQIRIWENILLPFLRNEECKAKSIVLITNKNRSVINNKMASEDKAKYTIIPIEKEENIFTYHQYDFKNSDFFPRDNKPVMLWLNRILVFEDSERIIDLILEHKDNPIKTLFVCLTALCLFSRIASLDILKNLYLTLGYTKLQFYKNIKSLVKNKFVLLFPFIKHTVYLDTNITKLFAKHYRKEPIYVQVLSFYVEGYPLINCAEKWLLNCESRLLNILPFNQKENRRLFKDAFNYGNYSFLLSELLQIISSNKRKEYLFYKELGYLYEKIGDRDTAIIYIKKYLQVSPDVEEKQKIYLLLFEITHHVDQSIEKLLKLKHSNNLYIKLQSEYWLKHIEIEKGNFNYDELKSVKNMFLQIKQYQDEINYYHILRRMFSDLARVYFLEGKINKETFIEFRNDMQNSGLNRFHSEYEDFFNLLTKAHYLHYDVIFQLGFYGRFIHDCDDKYGENPKVDEMISKAIDEYQKCETNFKNYGDKAWYTISIRKNELKVCSDIQPIKLINELESQKNLFIKNHNELHLAFVCCVICKVKFLNLYFNPFESDLYSAIDECHNLLSEAEKLYSKFENKYGLYRIYFIRAFLDLYSGIQNEDNKETAIDVFRQKITDLKKISYYREYEMIESILKHKTIEMDLITRFFKYYPIVLQ